MSVTREQRHTRQHRCPVCEGGDSDPRGKGKRCSGFTPNDEWTHCSREEFAGDIEVNDAGLFAHRMHGSCHCGATHGEARSGTSASAVEATYDYTDEHGALLFQVVRKSGKQFRQRKPDGAGGWIWKLGDVPRVPYRLRELVEADVGRVVHIVEGEKDVDSLANRRLLATCNPGGAGKWPGVADLARVTLAGRDIIVVADRDDVGRKHALEVADSLRSVARSLVTLIPPPPHKDVSDLLQAGHTLLELVPVDATTERTAAPPCDPWTERVTSSETAWFTDAPPKRRWLLRDGRTALSTGVLPLGKVGLLIAEGGAGKTMTLVALAIAGATGATWFGCYVVATAGRVLLLLGEEDAEEVHRRCYSVARATGAPVPKPGSITVLPLAGLPCPMVEADEKGNAQDAAFLHWLRSYIAQHGPFTLILVDPLSRFAGADAEIDNAAATRFVQALESIATETGATVIVAHHTNKTARGNGAAVTGASARGSSAIYDGVRWAAALSSEHVEMGDPDTAARLGELVTLSIVKSNYSRKGEPLLLRRDQENGGALLPLDEIDLQMVRDARAHLAPRVQRQAKRDEAGKARTTSVADAIRAALRTAPGLSGRKLLAAVVARLGQCSRPTLDAAVAALGAEIRTVDGPDRSTLHYLAGGEP